MVAVRERVIGIEEAGSRSTTILTVMPARAPRRDALPEHTAYVDSGCKLHSSCLTCPLVRCRFDEPGGARKLLADERDRGIIALRREGRGIDAIASRFSVSRRTVFRVLAQARSG